ncbi:hypothetical protein SmJEL517_g03293 [Synchytrium microbalum]|uniref:Uncharacterized protein n=1 Tax=Synchytrium microbalum TaxID=1806994 RepID=A0A507C8P6_9FUNG|nr:uncharacterized protein SmJEL517_g03293 [Synchytrium microbalum]TPX33903.1 hypothetical protein SmJEL517_g03293 [Synchytrium microbalum]
MIQPTAIEPKLHISANYFRDLRHNDGLSNEISAVSFSHNGRIFASLNISNSIAIFDVILSRLICTIQLAVTAIASKSKASMEFSPDNSNLAVLAGSTLSVWNLHRQEWLQGFDATFDINTLCWVTEHKLVTGDINGSIRIWDIQDAEATTRASPQPLDSMITAVIPRKQNNSRDLVVTTLNGIVYTMSYPALEITKETVLSARVTSASMLSEGFLIVGSTDGRVGILNHGANTPRMIKENNIVWMSLGNKINASDSEIISIKVQSPHWGLALSAKGKITIWDLRNRMISLNLNQYTLPGRKITCMGLSRHGLAAMGMNDGQAKLYKMEWVQPGHRKLGSQSTGSASAANGAGNDNAAAAKLLAMAALLITRKPESGNGNIENNNNNSATPTRNVKSGKLPTRARKVSDRDDDTEDDEYDDETGDEEGESDEEYEPRPKYRKVTTAARNGQACGVSASRILTNRNHKEQPARVAVWKDYRVHIIAKEYGNLSTPSVVAFADPTHLVGKDAIALTINPSNTVRNAKRLMGRQVADPEVQSDIVNHEGKPFVQVEFGGTTRTLAPEDILSVIMLKMKEITEAYLGIPATFNYSQHMLVKQAVVMV